MPMPRQQWVEQTAVWVVAVPANRGDGRIVFDGTVQRFSELRQAFALVTMSEVRAEPIIDGVQTTAGSMMLAFATDRIVTRSRNDIMGREGYMRVSGSSQEQRALDAQLGGIHASRHIDVASRSGSPGLVLDYDSTVAIACSIRIVVRTRCSGPLSGGAVGTAPVTPNFPAQSSWASNVPGLLRVTMGPTANGTHLRVQAGNWERFVNNAWGPLTIGNVAVTAAQLPASSAAYATAQTLGPGVHFFM